MITAGLPRKPGMSRMDLLEVNAKIVGEVTRKLVAGSPDSVLIVVSNPLDEMTALAAQVSGFPTERVMGQAGMLDTARFKHFVAEQLGIPPLQVEAITLGSHGDTMVPVPSQVKVAGKPLAEVVDAETIERLVQRTRDGGAEIVGLLKTGSAYYAPSSRGRRDGRGRASATPARSCRSAPGSRASTASPTSTSACPAKLGRARHPARSSSCRSPTTSSPPSAPPPRPSAPSRPTWPS